MRPVMMPTVTLPGTRVKLLALVNVHKESGRLGMLQLGIAPFGLIEQVAQGELVAKQLIDPFGAPFRPFGAGAVELPSVEKRLDQRPNRLRAWTQREKAPTAAFAEDSRPRARVFGRLRPGLSPQGGQHAGLRDRRLANARVAEKYRNLVRRNRERIERRDGFSLSPEEIVAVLLIHGGQTAVGRRVAP